MKGSAHDDASRVPRLARELAPAAIRELPLSPVDGFVLSRIDGTLSVADLAQATGVDAGLVTASIEKLVGLGVVRFVGAPETSTSGTFSRTAPPVAPGSGVRIDAHAPPPVPPPRPVSSPAIPAVPATPSAPGGGVEDGADLEPALRARVNELHARLTEVDHYTLLAVGRDADRKAVKRSYYELAAIFHPDRFFRKNLGTYKARMEAIFARITLAHDVLTSKEARAEYDAYLGDVATARAVEESFHGTAPSVEASAPPPAAPSVEVPRAAPVPAIPQVSAPLAPAAPAVSSAPPPRVSLTPLGTPAMDEQARRDALARRLRGGRPSKPPGAGPTPPPFRAPAPAAADALRRQYEERQGATRAAIARRHTDAGAAAMARGDIAGAVQAYKKALEFAPEDPDLKRALEKASTTAQAALAETYERQAHYEQKNGQWTEAAASWGRLAELVPGNSLAQERTAHALVQAKGDLHRAANFGRRAVELEPQNAAFRVTLANVYMAAGLQRNARRELEAAQQLSPDDASIGALLKRVGHS